MIIKMTENKALIITIKTTLYRGEKNADVVRFLIPAEYEGHNLADCVFLMKYIRADGNGKSEPLEYLPELYKGYLQLSTIVNTRLTSDDGEVVIWLTALDQNDGVVLKTGEVVVDIEPSKNISDYFSDEDLDELDSLSARIDALERTKADNIICDENTSEIQLTARGERIGLAIDLSSLENITNDAVHFGTGEDSDDSHPDEDGDDVIYF